MNLMLKSIWSAGLLGLAAIYLFVSAPPELPDGESSAAAVPAEAALRILDTESAAIRALYTSRIVGPGQKQGLKFAEDWKKDGVEAGPLPALMLRETSNRLQMRVPELSLFLGSDYPIVKENLFTGEQARYYDTVKRTLAPQYFYDEAQGRSVAMFPDLASAQACVTCHNEHPTSPKTDWVLNEPMGATTWSFAGKAVTAATLLRMIEQLRTSALDSYSAYLEKTRSFPVARRPEIGVKWPTEGLYLPSRDAFRAEMELRNSARTLQSLFAANGPARRAASDEK
jgi:adenylate cyclase